MGELGETELEVPQLVEFVDGSPERAERPVAVRVLLVLFAGREAEVGSPFLAGDPVRTVCRRSRFAVVAERAEVGLEEVLSGDLGDGAECGIADSDGLPDLSAPAGHGPVEQFQALFEVRRHDVFDTRLCAHVCPPVDGAQIQYL